MPSPRKTKAKHTALPEQPTLPPQPKLAAWFRQMATLADEGKIIGQASALLILGASSPVTSIHDPNDSFARMTLSGTVEQLQTMLHDTEHRQRMASLAARLDVTPPQA